MSWLIAGLLLLGAAHVLHADDKSALLGRIQATESSTSLDLEGLKPWHLKLSVQLYDDKGKPSQQGTIEEWWADSTNYRITYTLPPYSATELHVDGHAYRSKGAGSEPALLDALLRQVVHPMPNQADLNETFPALRKQKIGNVDLDCIMLNRSAHEAVAVPLGLFPTYCLDPGKTTLRLVTEFGSPTYIRNKTGTFQGHTLATQIDAKNNGIATTTGQVAALSTVSPTSIDLTPAADMEAVGGEAARVDDSTQAIKIILKVPPIYPTAAKTHRSSGRVVLGVLIGRDGHVREVHIRSTPDPDLAVSAIDAVRQWTYTPYLLNGLPVEVSTTVTVNYLFR